MFKEFTRMHRRRILCLPIGLAIVALAAGCPRSAQKASGPPTVRVAFFPNITHAAALHASASGAFHDALGSKGVLEEHVFSAGPAEIEALFAGEVDFGYIGPGPAINGYEKSGGKALRIVSGAASGGAGLAARKGVPISGIKDLSGKRIAVPQTGGSQDISLRTALRAAGLESKDKGGSVDVLQFAPADALVRMERGEIDAAWLPEPWVSRLERELGARLVLDERTLWPGKRFSTAVVIVRTAFAEEHPDLVEALLGAHRRSVEAFAKDPERARRIVGEKIAELNAGKKIPDAILQSSFERTEITTDRLEESILLFADRAKELGYLRKGAASLADLFAR
ncbi:MAG: ABC transporter substrate-binding protein [Armatimonadota bacterium]